MPFAIGDQRDSEQSLMSIGLRHRPDAVDQLDTTVSASEFDSMIVTGYTVELIKELQPSEAQPRQLSPLAGPDNCGLTPVEVNGERNTSDS